VRSVPLRYLVTEIDERTGNEGPLLSVSIHSGVHRRDEVSHEAPRADTLEGYKRCRRGDLVLNRMRAFQGAVGVSPTDGLVSPDYAVLRPSIEADARFIAYSLRSAWGVAEMASRLRGIGGVAAGMVRTPRINVGDLIEIRLHLPARSRQSAIADFLDRECERVASLTAALERLDRATAEVMRQWFLATVAPAKRIPLRRWITAIADGPFGSSLASSHYVAHPGVRVIRLGDIGVAELREGAPAFVDRDYAAGDLAQHRVATGDLVMAGLGDANNPLARTAVVPASFSGAIHKADCYRIQIDRNQAEPEYVAWALSCGPAREEAPLLARGSTRPRLNTVVARDLPIPQLPLEEQRTIVRSAVQKREKLRAVSDYAELLRARLAEYREALITEAVTGQLDVSAVPDAHVEESALAAAADVAAVGPAAAPVG
jgi:type I restriction enzyme S subunit